MDKAGAIGKNEAEKISKQMTTLNRVGETLTKTGALLTKSVTVPLVGIGVAAGKMAVDFETNFAKVSTLLTDNTDFSKYKESIIQGSNDMKTSVGEYSDAVYQAISAGVDQANAVEFTNNAIKLAKGGFTDASSAVDILTTAINAYGMEASDATKVSDLLITSQNLGKTTCNELSSSLGKVIPTANAFHVSLSDVTTSVADLTKNGIATAESVTYLNGMFNELGSSGTKANTAIQEMSGKTFADFMDSGGSLTEALGMVSQKAQESGVSLADMFGSTEAAKAALTIMKDDGVEYNNILGQMNDSAGATQKAFEKIDATPAEQLSGALNKLKNAGIELGGSLVPMITKVADVVEKAADKFSNMSEAQQESIIKWGAMAAAAGPVLSVTGKAITTFTKIAPILKGTSAAASAAAEAVGGSSILAAQGVTALASACLPLVAGTAVVGAGIYAIHENNKLMGRSCIDASDDMSGMEKVLAKFNGTDIKTREELEKLGLVQKKLSDNLSDDFKKAVEESTKKTQDFNLALDEINMDDVITQEESDSFTNSVNQMCSDVIETINSKKDEAQNGMKELMIADDGVISDSEQHILDILSQSSNDQINEVQTLQGEIIAIKQKAVDEGRALNEQEIADIKEKNEKIRAIELEAVGGTEEEILYAKNDFATRVKTMDAESASELLQQKASERDEEITKITASYDTQIELLKSKMSEMSDADKTAAQKQIDQWEETKQKKIDKQNELYDEYLKIVNDGNANIADVINKYNGEMLTNEDLKNQQMMEAYQNAYSGLESITKSGTYEMYNQQKETWDKVTVSVDQATGDITGAWSDTVGMSAGYTKQMAEDAKSASASFTGAANTIVGASDIQIDAMDKIITKDGTVVGTMKDVKAATDGVRRGVVDINGTPYDIKVNKDGTIASLKEISSAAEEAAKDRVIHISAQYMGNASISAYDGVTSDRYGWHFNGLDSVPYDGYKAILHKDERVLTAKENKEYSTKQDVNYEAIRAIIRNEMSGFVMKVNEREFGRIVREVT